MRDVQGDEMKQKLLEKHIPFNQHAIAVWRCLGLSGADWGRLAGL